MIGDTCPKGAEVREVVVGKLVTGRLFPLIVFPERVERQSSSYELLKNSLKLCCLISMRIGAGGFFGGLPKNT